MSASTLAEARALDPAGYDAVLVDANLGPERGIDLVKALRAADPAAASRCLVITGGAVDMLPDDVAYLAKPFQVGELLEAVRALNPPDAAPAPDPIGGIAPDSGVQPPAAMPPGDNPPAAQETKAWRLLDITRRMRARERREMTDFLHDGPIQELTAASLELQMLRRSAPPGEDPRLDAAQQLQAVAAGSLRWLVDGNWPFVRPETELASALQQRIGWLLAEPVTLDKGERPAGLSAIEVPIIVDVVELMLLGMAPASPPVRAAVAVRAEDDLIEIELTVVSAEDEDQAIGDPATAKASLTELASVLRASAHSEFCDHLWRAWLGFERTDVSALQQ
jgi:DNA-binding response OmpR family regulator